MNIKEKKGLCTTDGKNISMSGLSIGKTVWTIIQQTRKNALFSYIVTEFITFTEKIKFKTWSVLQPLFVGLPLNADM